MLTRTAPTAIMATSAKRGTGGAEGIGALVCGRAGDIRAESRSWSPSNTRGSSAEVNLNPSRAGQHDVPHGQRRLVVLAGAEIGQGRTHRPAGTSLMAMYFPGPRQSRDWCLG
jgi:hypothetical protein